ncbi:MAG: hypothetical protein HFI97_09410 [Lachnospiraceae bacterium]|jgi:ppGpp synthetase/RelA/SpoT-type nucleotidyltranferase|nr:hypothetical protein [Lachnospiraceae bacterium]MCI9097010.1 hypothetical protein [Lachnospiraceae bacterium]MCI9203911.1 hypothetical protein [Lachnospiraceae bacterium]
MEWEAFWDTLLDEHKLRRKVEEMDQVDALKGHTTNTKEICHCIYDDYSMWREECEKRKDEIWKIIEGFSGVHLHTSRIKNLESLIEKVIRKRHEWLGDDESRYANISAKNYRDIITDLVGLRLIINYRGHWLDMHQAILSQFPMAQDQVYGQDKLLAHIEGRNIQAELPKAYYAQGDDIRQYIDHGLIPKKHKMNYRSIHYTLSFKGVYIEIQIRTIYDEAWSDCDHSYVYKKDDNKSHAALQQMSGILAKLTNLSNDIGEQMKEIFDSEAMIDNHGNGWRTSRAVLGQIDRAIFRISEIENDLTVFKNKLTVEETLDLNGGAGENG